MGAACNSFCSKEDTLNQTQPNTHSIVGRLGIPSLGRQTSAREGGNVTNEFHEAIRTGNISAIMFYLEEYPSLDLMNTTYNNQTALQSAVEQMQHSILQYLLEQNALVNEQEDTHGNTALHIAAKKGDVKSVKLLIKYKADKSIKNNAEMTAMDIALDKKHRAIAKHLEPNKQTLRILTTERQNAAPKHLATPLVHKVAADILVESPDMNAPRNHQYDMNTGCLNDVTDDIWDDIQTDIHLREAQLVAVKGWVDRKQQSPPYSWLRRWVICSGGYLLWSDRQINIGKDGVTEQEKKRWNKCVFCADIENLSIIDESKKERKFKFTVKGREYAWRAESKQMRDHWIKTLKDNVAVYSAASLYGTAISPMDTDSSKSRSGY